MLVHTDVVKYLEFKAVDGSFVLNRGRVEKVPATDYEALRSPLMGLFEKRRARSFFMCALGPRSAALLAPSLSRGKLCICKPACPDTASTRSLSCKVAPCAASSARIHHGHRGPSAHMDAINEAGTRELCFGRYVSLA